MPTAENTSKQAFIDSISSTIDYLPGAIIVVDKLGEIQRFNQVAARLLGLSAQGQSLFEVATATESLRDLLRQALRTSSTFPFAFTRQDSTERLSGSIRSLPAGSAGARSMLLIACHDQGSASHKMRLLNQQLEEALHKQRRLLKQNRKLRKTVEVTLPRLREQSIRDPLTGLYNRRYFDQEIAEEWRRATRANAAISLVYLDLDYFKKFNDACGHVAGDACLRAVASALTNSIAREFDGVSRIGGEEFAFLLPMTDEQGAACVAARALESIHALNIEHPQADSGRVTASLGRGSCFPKHTDDLQRFIIAVDQALYLAKSSGRNRVCHINADWRQAADGQRADVSPAGAS